MSRLDEGAGRAAQWAGLVALSLGVSAVLEIVRLPAAFLIGPLVAGVTLRLAGFRLKVPKPFFLASQAVIGGMLGAALTPSIVSTVREDWAVIFGAVAVVVATAMLFGWLMARFGVVPGTTGVWGSSPGAASAMVIQAAAHGADVRMVAVMQYVRVLIVASSASVVARLWIDVGGEPPPFVPFPPLHAGPLALTVLIVAVAGGLGVLSRMPSGAMILPLLVAAGLNGAGVFHLDLPPWLLITAYAGIGWTIGLGFDREALAHAARALPWILASILGLMAVAGGVAVLLVVELGVDPLTAYLATSPGGMDTVAIIATSTPVDVSFVLALQAMRFFVLVAIGPALSRAVARRLPRSGASGS